MKLTDPTDDQLNAAFAEHVAGYYVKEEFPGTDFPFTAWQGDRRLSHQRWASPKGPLEYIQSFVNSADEVLPWLEKIGMDAQITYSDTCSNWVVILMQRFTGKNSFRGNGETFSRAAVIALLRAHNVEVEFTQ